MLASTLVRVNRPRPPHELVPRPSLISKLNAGLDLPVTLISASAGFGKTTLLLEWLDVVSLPVAWLSLEENPETLESFTAKLVDAIRSVFPGALGSIVGLLNAPNPLAPARLADALSSKIAELPVRFALVLDDYQLIKSPPIDAMMGALVRHVPASMHLVISTRHDPPLPLAKLRASGLVSELRSSDLRFTDVEARELLVRLVKRDLPAQALRLVEEAVEGWVTGIRFAAYALSAGATEEELVETAGRLNRHPLKDYFLNEIFLQQPPSTQEFLLKTSLMERFTAGACEALMEDRSGANWRAILDKLVQDEAMLVVLDESEGWYRYHHLFRDFLRFRVAVVYDAKTISELHLRASRWNAKQGFFTQAIQHAIAAGSCARAAELVSEGLRPELDKETARPVIDVWLRLFPEKEQNRHLGLVMARLWREGLQLSIPSVARLVPLAEQLLAEAGDLDVASRSYYLGEIAQAKSGLGIFTNQPARALEAAAQALHNLPRESVYARGNALAFTAQSYQMTGQAAAGIQLLMESLKDHHNESPHMTLRLLAGLGLVQLQEADYAGLAETAARMEQLASDLSYLTQGWAHYFQGVVHYEWDQLVAAAQHFAQGAELRFNSNAKFSHESFAWLALTQQAQGLTTANATLEEVRQFSDEMQSGSLALSTDAYRARLALMQGNIGAALRWARTAPLEPAPHMWWDIEPHLTRIRVLLAMRKTEFVRQALTEASALLEVALSLHNRRRAIQLYALRALALDMLGQTTGALDALQASVELAQRGGFIRTFVDLGPRMAHLLSLLQARNVAPGYVAGILGAVSGTKHAASPARSAETASARLIEPLTRREMQVLEGLVNHLTAREIAQELVISPLTVKTHIDHIYAKLGVNKRRDAVRVVLAYGLVEKGSDGQMTVETGLT